MIICKNCNVELEENMPNCPLCGEPVTGNGNNHLILASRQHAFPYSQKMSRPQKKFTWEIVSLILLSGIITTLIIDYIITKQITWSEYPVAISLIIFTYVSLFAFWHQRTIIQMTGGFIISSFFVVMLDALTADINWSFKLGIPILFEGNLLTAALIAVFRLSKYKGINLLAYAFLGAAMLCICIEGVLSYSKTKSFQLDWSVIDAGCIIPIVLLLLFTHFRLKKGRNLEKTFHI